MIGFGGGFVMKKNLSTSVLGPFIQPPPKPIILNSGPFSVVFDPSLAFLRYLRFGDQEVLRSIYGALRDEKWRTPLPTLSNLAVEQSTSGFKISFDAFYSEGSSIDFGWRGTIEAEGPRISFSFNGRSRSTFPANRIGICVLHPITECAGKPCSVEKTDGTIQDGVFPLLVSPHQPFKNIRAVRHEVVPGVQAEVRFSGEVFEMEDQRNWTDGSYKIYSRPLELGWPYEVPRGTEISQTVTVSLLGGGIPSHVPSLLEKPRVLEIPHSPDLAKRFPIGLRSSDLDGVLSYKSAELIKSLELSFLQGDLLFAATIPWKNQLQRIYHEAVTLGLDLHLALFLTNASEIDALCFEIKSSNLSIKLFLVYSYSSPLTPTTLIELAKQKIGEISPESIVAAGTPIDFVQLNRNRPLPETPCLPSFGINPQIHLVDQLSIIENLDALPYAIHTCYDFTSKPVVLSPVGLKGGLTDIRHNSLFEAAWTVGVLSKLLPTGNIHSLAFAQTIGSNGIFLNDGSPSPVFHVLHDLAGYKEVYALRSSHPIQVLGLMLINAEKKHRILLANLVHETQEIDIVTGSCNANILLLDETNISRAQESTLSKEHKISDKVTIKLLPYGIARIDIL
eukprot:TRINITY_DN13799_c0_g1_i1.p1 TRINITY_DN13799_c0_g1~~TRINITY_DN13799_c0_g1_i1.p1  ORF type:complete len:620 (+),score=87.17 TRINITY_DN13799_c0_g1_i1:1790-3649(+)